MISHEQSSEGLLAVSPEQLAALEQGPGIVTNSAESYLMSAAEIDNVGNFAAHFVNGLAGDIYRATAHYRRYAIIYPEEAALLNQLGATNSPDNTDPRFRSAYAQMRTLVDVTDPYVVRNGIIDSLFLLR